MNPDLEKLATDVDAVLRHAVEDYDLTHAETIGLFTLKVWQLCAEADKGSEEEGGN